MRGTSEGRRLFAGCVGVGVGLGSLAGVGAGVAFRHGAEYLPCHPENFRDQSTCPEIDVAGFQMHSSVGAGFTVGAVVALIAWVLSVIAVLYSTHHHHPHDPPPYR
jgi:hypothetical protein